MNFTEFALDENLQKGIADASYVTCTPVQEQVLKASIEGRDLYVQSQTGTGKTAAYLISVIQEMLCRENVKGKKALIMVPTRELAVQVEEEAKKLTKYTQLKTASFYGGVGYDRQVSMLKKNVDILIGTPGRVIDLYEGKQMDLSGVAFLVVDEADRMFDMGFYPDLRTLIKVLPQSEKRETMLFSATLNSYVKNLAWEYTRDPIEITIAAENITVEEIDQELLHVSSDEKMKLLVGIITKENPESLIIFCNTKRTCEVVSKRLVLNGIKSEFIIGDLPQKKRLVIMKKFKEGEIKCLCATDVAARGIDVNDLSMVINYDLPNEAENYVHRIGRTARAGKSGKAYTFCSEQDVYSLPAIERYIEKSIPSNVASPDMMAEDKSAGTYIRTDTYHEDYNDKSDFGKKRQSEYKNKKSSYSGGKKATRGQGRYSKKNEDKAREYRRDRRVYNNRDEVALETMSTEERMKFYKEKYGKYSFADSSSKKNCSKTKGEKYSSKNTNVSSKNKKSFGKNKNYNNLQSSNKNNVKKVTEKKIGLFAKIKNLFSRKGK